MVSYNQILASNGLISDSKVTRITVFVGGTSGIGLLTIRALVASQTSVRIYMVGRQSSAQRMQSVIEELRNVNPRTEIIWTEGEITLLAEVKRICEVIKSAEPRVDLLFMTAGYCPFGTRIETSEGLEISQSLSYFSRVLFMIGLLPLLRESDAPRVVGVFGGGLERTNSVNLEDLELKKPGNFGPKNAQLQTIAMNTLAMEKLASENEGVTFIHSWPGSVDTGNVKRGLDPNSIMSWIVYLFLGPLIHLFSMKDEKSGQRHLFQCTSAAFGGQGVPWMGDESVIVKQVEGRNGVILLNYRCDPTPNAKVMHSLRESAMEKVWAYTWRLLEPYS